MWRRWSTRTSVSPYGTSAARTRSAPYGGTTSRTHRYDTLTFDLRGVQWVTFDLFAVHYLNEVFSISAFVLSLMSSWSPQGLIFVVDSNDRERVAESAEELAKMVCVFSLSLSLSGCLSDCLSACLSLSRSLFVCLSLSLSLCQSVCLSLSPSVCLSLCLSLPGFSL